jgi:hypothetical protein
MVAGMDGQYRQQSARGGYRHSPTRVPSARRRGKWVLVVGACLLPAAAAVAVFAMAGAYRAPEGSDPAAARAFTNLVQELLSEQPDLTLDVRQIAGHEVDTVCLIPFFDTVGEAADDMGRLAFVPEEFRNRYIGDHNVGLLMIGHDQSSFGELDGVWSWDFFPPRGCYEGGPFALRANDLVNLDGLVLIATGSNLELELASPSFE